MNDVRSRTEVLRSDVPAGAPIPRTHRLGSGERRDKSIHLWRGGAALPHAVVTQVLAILAKRGAGKTYAAMRLAEQLLAAGAQIAALDPVGVWWGLRLDKGGTEASPFGIPVFGGLHGDLPLEPPNSGPVDRAPRDAVELVRAWTEKLPGGAAAAIFSELTGAYPGALERDQAAARSGYSAGSSTFRNALSALRRVGLIEEPNGALRASDWLFMGGR